MSSEPAAEWFTVGGNWSSFFHFM